jgi:hypothetical protein
MKTKILFFLLLLLGMQLRAQNDLTFKVYGDSVKHESFSASGRLEISKILVQNIADKPIFLEWKTVENSFPKGWDCGMCQHGACQIGIPKGSEFRALNPDQQGFIALHIIPNGLKGKGKVTFLVRDRHRPKEGLRITFYAEAF